MMTIYYYDSALIDESRASVDDGGECGNVTSRPMGYFFDYLQL